MDLGGKKRCKLAVFWDENAIFSGTHYRWGRDSKKKKSSASFFVSLLSIDFLCDWFVDRFRNKRKCRHYIPFSWKLCLIETFIIGQYQKQQSEAIWKNLKQSEALSIQVECSRLCRLCSSSRKFFSKKIKNMDFLWIMIQCMNSTVPAICFYSHILLLIRSNFVKSISNLGERTFACFSRDLS